MRVVTANINGIRAAARRGGLAWLRGSGADVIALQEVRASVGVATEVLTAHGFDGWHWEISEGGVAGRAGVALVSRWPLAECSTDEGDPAFGGSGRWVQARVLHPDGHLVLASTYVHTGHVGAPIQNDKHRFLDAIAERLRGWAARGERAVLVGDLNIAHTDDDLKNWQGNRGKAGCLPSERGRLTSWREDLGWRDVHRDLHGPGPGPYTWWTWRGQAFDNDAGWRIDYQWASPALAPMAVRATVGRAPTYAERWSDHAPLTVDFEV